MNKWKKKEIYRRENKQCGWYWWVVVVFVDEEDGKRWGGGDLRVDTVSGWLMVRDDDERLTRPAGRQVIVNILYVQYITTYKRRHVWRPVLSCWPTAGRTVDDDQTPFHSPFSVACVQVFSSNCVHYHDGHWLFWRGTEKIEAFTRSCPVVFFEDFVAFNKPIYFNSFFFRPFPFRLDHTISVHSIPILCRQLTLYGYWSPSVSATRIYSSFFSQSISAGHSGGLFYYFRFDWLCD